MFPYDIPTVARWDYDVKNFFVKEQAENGRGEAVGVTLGAGS